MTGSLFNSPMTPSIDTTKLDRTSMIQLLKILDAKDKTIRESTLRSMEFSLIQEEALVAALTGCKIPIVCGANQSGKSTLGAVLLAICMTGIIPDSLTKRTGDVALGRGDYLSLALDFTSSHGISQAKVFEFVPPRLVEHFHKELRLLKLAAPCRSSLLFKSMDSGWEKIQGFIFNGLWVDEEPAQEMIWNEAGMRTIARDGFMLMTFSPLRGLSWSYKRLYRNAVRFVSTKNTSNIPEDVGIVHTLEEIEQLKERQLCELSNSNETTDPNIQFFQMSIYDTRHLPSKRIQDKEREFQHDPIQYQARILGQFTKIVGREVFNTIKLTSIQSGLAGHGTRYEILENEQLKAMPMGRLTSFVDKKDGHIYVIGADSAEGTRDGDYSCAQILDRTTCEQVAIWHGHCSPEEFARILNALGKHYNTAKLAPERNFHGIGIVNALRHQFKYPKLYCDIDVALDAAGSETTQKRFGWLTNTRTKPLMIQLLSVAVTSGQLKMHDMQTIEEMLTFVYNDDGKMEARGGCYDDRVIALAIAVAVMQRTPLPSITRRNLTYDTIRSKALGY